MSVQLIRKVRDRQPLSKTNVVKRFGVSDVYLPITLQNNLAGYSPATNTTYLSFGQSSGYNAFKTTANDNFPMRFPLAAAWSSYLIVIAENESHPYGLIDDAANVKIRCGEGNIPVLYVGETLSLTPALSQSVTKGSVIFASFNNANYVLAHKPKNGIVEYSTNNWADGNSTGHYLSANINARTALIAHWRDKAPPREDVICLLNNPWQIFEPETIPLFFSTGAPVYSATIDEIISAISDTGATVIFASDSDNSVSSIDSMSATAISSVEKTEAGSASDVIDATMFSIYAVSVIESGSSNDSSSAIASFSANSSETILAIDLPGTIAQFFAGLSESVAGQESISTTQASLQAIDEPSTSSDTNDASTFSENSGDVTESLSSADQASVVASFVTSFFASVDSTGEQDSTSSIVLSVSESVSWADVADGLSSDDRAVIEGSSAVDTLSVIATISVVETDSATAEDAQNSAVSFVVTGSAIAFADDIASSPSQLLAWISETVSALDLAWSSDGNAHRKPCLFVFVQTQTPKVFVQTQTPKVFFVNKDRTITFVET